MKIVSVQELKNGLSTYLRQDQPVAITRCGKILGILYPVTQMERLAGEVRTGGDHVPVAVNEAIRKALLLAQVRKMLKVRAAPALSATESQNAWKSMGSLSQEIIKERDKR